MNQSQKQLNWKVLLGVGITSMTLFMYEIILSRLYSTLLLYHYVFMIASIAILGMGIGSILQYKVQSKDTFNESVDSLLCKKGFQLGGVIVLSFLLIYFLPYLTVPIYILINMVPYIFAGQLFAILFTTYGEKSNSVYFADLIGAGIGAVGSVVLFYRVGFISGVGSTFALMFLGIWVWSINSKHYKVCMASALLGGIFFVVSLVPSFTNFIESQFTGYMTSPDSSLARLRKADEKHEIIYTKWDGYARTDVIRMPENESRRIVTINGGANASMMQWSGNLSDDGGMKKEIDYSPYVIGNSDDVAIVGAGGGKDVLLALLGGAKSIDAIEINASAVDATKKMGEYNGKIYEHPGVNVIVGDGSSSIAKSDKQYDVIFLSLVMTSTSESMGLFLS